MLEYIGEQIRTQVFARLTWISRAGGYTELLEANDGGTQKRFPGTKPQYQVPCEPGDYLNMGPDGKETCIAFVDSPGLIQVDERRSKYERVSVPFRVVVWYDDRKVRYDGPADKAGQMAKEIIAYARAATLSTTGVSGCKVSYDSIDFDPARIWGAYGFTFALEAPAVYWGRDGRCFAFLHDLTADALAEDPTAERDPGTLRVIEAPAGHHTSSGHGRIS